MDKETFIKKAQEICRASFIAYFVENNFPKSCKDMPTERFKSFCTDKLHSCVNYEAFMDYLMPTDCYEKSAIAENIEIHVPFATDELCVILLTADINYLVDNGYVMQFHCRTSYVVVQRQGKLYMVSRNVPIFISVPPSITLSTGQLPLPVCIPLTVLSFIRFLVRNGLA